MDFSKIKSFRIPEGNLKTASVGGAMIWQTDRYDRVIVGGESSGEVERKYTLSGTWVFDENPTVEFEKTYTESIKFTSNGDSYSILTAVGHYGYTRITFKNRNGDISADGMYDVYDPTNFGGWEDQAYRTITFDGEQTVSKEFYEWFTDNAEPLKLDAPTISLDGDVVAISTDDNTDSLVIYNNGNDVSTIDIVPVSGKWGFDTYVDTRALNRIECCNFIANGVLYTGMGEIDHDLHYYRGDSTTEVAEFMPSDAPNWTSESYRTITFEDTQYVSRKFYEWLDDNAEEVK